MRYQVKLLDGTVVGSAATFTGTFAILAQYLHCSGEIVDTLPHLPDVY